MARLSGGGSGGKAKGAARKDERKKKAASRGSHQRLNSRDHTTDFGFVNDKTLQNSIILNSMAARVLG
jgi:hypothetical protein